MPVTKNFNAQKSVIDSSIRKSVFFQIKEIWLYREIFIALAFRDIKARYKQSVLGILWVIIQPIVTCLVFTIVFGYFVRVDSGDTPYPVFVFSGLLLWQFFSRNLGEGTGSLVANSAFINKVYFPRMGIPLIGLLASTVDFLLALVVLFVLMIWFGVAFQPQIIFAPLIVLVTFCLSYAGALIFSPLNAIYRDVGMAIGYGTQFLMYLSPVIYPVSFLPENYQWLFDFNPVATLLNWMRWALIGTTLPSSRAFIVLGVTVIVFLFIGRTVFSKLEANVVDRI
jgi:lipopolysaccharide transport system permease protein